MLAGLYKGRIPISTPIRGTKAHVLGDDDLLVPHNEVGELCIRGTNVSCGYLNNEVVASFPSPDGEGCWRSDVMGAI